jgi:hypothetical protein
MSKIVKVADGAFFVPSYSDQTIVRAYSTDTTIQSFGFGGQEDEQKESYPEQEMPGQRPSPDSSG